MSGLYFLEAEGQNTIPEKGAGLLAFFTGCWVELWGGGEVGWGLDHELLGHELLLDQMNDGGEVLLALDGVDVVDPNLEQFFEEFRLDVVRYRL